MNSAKGVCHCLKFQATKKHLKSTTVHFSNHLVSPDEYVLLTNCLLNSFQTISQ